MGTIRIWEGVKGWNGVNSFVEREYEGQLLGTWKPDDCEDEYYVYLLDDNRILIYIHNEKSANIHEFNDLDDAANAGADEVLYMMSVVSNHKLIERWRKTFPYRCDYFE